LEAKDYIPGAEILEAEENVNEEEDEGMSKAVLAFSYYFIE